VPTGFIQALPAVGADQGYLPAYGKRKEKKGEKRGESLRLRVSGESVDLRLPREIFEGEGAVAAFVPLLPAATLKRTTILLAHRPFQRQRRGPHLRHRRRRGGGAGQPHGPRRRVGAESEVDFSVTLPVAD